MFFMAFTTPHSHLYSYTHFLMQIGQGILLIVILLWDSVSSWVTLLLPGVARNKLLLLVLVLRLSIVLLLTLLRNFYGFATSLLIWVFLLLVPSLSIVTIRVLFRFLTMISSMIAPNILRLIVISFNIILHVALFIFFLFVLLINMLIFSPRLIPLVVSVI